MSVTKKCPFCKRQWPKDTEQSISIEFYGECIVCKFTPQGCGSWDGTQEELDRVAAEQKRRQK